jgi:large subunit ribosomal protein L4e
MPKVFQAPIRLDIVQFVHDNIARNKRQPHGVYEKAGMQHSAESWHTGRAVARVPRVGGSGTRRSSQAAFGNMCRKGRMFAPLKIWRRWHRKVNVTQKRHALAAAVAATAVPALVMARGHRIMDVPEIPLVFDKISAEKTKDFIGLLKKFGAKPELDRCHESKKIRATKGKMRNRRYVLRKGPLLIHGDSDQKKALTAARNIPGLDLMNVHRMNLLNLAPGGHIGRFVIWTKEAFAALDKVFTVEKTGYTYASPVMANADLGSIINSDQVQKILRPAKPNHRTHVNQKKNPLKNKAAMKKLNPFAPEIVKMEKAAEEERKKARATAAKTHRGLKKAGKKWMKAVMAGLVESMVPPPKAKEIYDDEEVKSVHEEMSEQEEEEKKEEKEEGKDEGKKEVKKEAKKEATKEAKKEEKKAGKEETKKEKKGKK